MFVLTTISDLIQIQPKELRKPIEEALEDNINQKYANRVLQNVGLCLFLWDVLRASEGLIGQGDGMINVNVEFRLVVFRPFKGEILQGVILDSSSPEGIRIGLDFFADIWIPAPTNLPEDSRLLTSEAKPVWVWNPNASEDPLNDDLSDAYFYEVDETVRFRVEDEIWHNTGPEKADFLENPNGDLTIRTHVAAGGFQKAADEKETAKQSPVPYAIIGSMAAAGLGCVHWWRVHDEGGEDGGEDDGGEDEMEGVE
ncbi:uncharacterized protein PV09_01692 [Verruconis gallopava]|uniref:DNA-directed RNA polymerase subunit n=1 Tax=Verruconis gallopava TaxID=253628 RepID=A0A0D2B930_9PEZI|nr:uncharacterized protein PV09_01692 [Verruconis gallopava]KIW07764.1 hypothetical protein PV09_01692 [Verruconis gallopava]